MFSHPIRSPTAWLLFVCGAAIGPAAPAMAQGCMPLRLTAPTFAGLHATYVESRQWRLGLAARRVTTNQFFVGSHPDLTAAPGGQPLYLRLNSVLLSASYGVSDRLSLTLNIPLSSSSASNVYPDGNRHRVSSSGIGDVSLTGALWLLDPPAHPNGNAALGLGLKAPTGSNHRTADFWLPGAVVSQPVTQTLQPGDGGWAILAHAQGFQQVVPRGWLYAYGQYSASLRQHTDVLWPPAETFWAVPDVYSARGGMGYAVLPGRGISLSAGGRIDGTATRNLFTGRDDSYRHAGYTLYFEPGVSWVRAHHVFSLNVPVRVHHNYVTMDTSGGPRPGVGGVPSFVVYASYAWRF